ncbi:MAG: hypothetical protein K0Q46_4518, partial [Rhodococcus erythropolis]|nr:hypothetical protein [Rhodococcus erythropolis]
MRVAADEYAGCPGLPPDITLDSAEWIGADIKVGEQWGGFDAVETQ